MLNPSSTAPSDRIRSIIDREKARATTQAKARLDEAALEDRVQARWNEVRLILAALTREVGDQLSEAELVVRYDETPLPLDIQAGRIGSAHLICMREIDDENFQCGLTVEARPDGHVWVGPLRPFLGDEAKAGFVTVPREFSIFEAGREQYEALFLDEVEEALAVRRAQ